MLSNFKTSPSQHLLSQVLVPDTTYKQIDHIALAVYNIDQAAALFADAFQLDLVMGLSYPPDGVHTNLVLSLGPQNELELMAPIGEKGFLTDFLKKHGEGFHHLALEVTDIDQATRHLEEKGVRIFGETTHKGMRFTFLHPSSTLRAGMQLVQRKPQKSAHNPMIKRLDHIAIGINSVEKGRDFFLSKLGAKRIASDRDERFNCRYDRFVAGDARFDLLYDFQHNSSGGIPEGVHHLALEVGDLSESIRQLEHFGIKPLDEWSDAKTIFLPPDKMYGCLWELSQL